MHVNKLPCRDPAPEVTRFCSTDSAPQPLCTESRSRSKTDRRGRTCNWQWSWWIKYQQNLHNDYLAAIFWRGKIWQKWQRFLSRVSGAETHVKKRFVQFWPIWKIFLYPCPWKINVKFWPIWKMSIPLPASSRWPFRWGWTVDTWCILEKMFLEYNRKKCFRIQPWKRGDGKSFFQCSS